MVLLQAFFCCREWFPWAWGGLVLIIASIWGQVHIMVELNTWSGSFYDTVQKAIHGGVSQDDLYQHFISFAQFAATFTVIATFKSFFIAHWSFRWRQAITEEYLKNWKEIYDIEGVSQRVQDDTMRFTKIAESTGGSCVTAVLTLISFMPLLSEYSEKVINVPMFGNVPNSLVYVSILWSCCLTLCFTLVGIKLPRLEFFNQLAEAAFRKEIVFAEGQSDRLAFGDIWQLFMDCRQRFVARTGHFSYFNFVTNLLVVSQRLVPLICLAPTIAAGKASLGMIQVITGTFSQVSGAFEILANNWTAIVELVSIIMRLHTLDMRLHGVKDKREAFHSETAEVV